MGGARRASRRANLEKGATVVTNFGKVHSGKYPPKTPGVEHKPSGLSMECRCLDCFYQAVRVMFVRTWKHIADDLRESFVEQAAIGDEYAKAAIKRGGLTPNEAFSMCVDFIPIYHNNQKWYEYWSRWINSDYKSARDAIAPMLTGFDF